MVEQTCAEPVDDVEMADEEMADSIEEEKKEPSRRDKKQNKEPREKELTEAELIELEKKASKPIRHGDGDNALANNQKKKGALSVSGDTFDNFQKLSGYRMLTHAMVRVRNREESQDAFMSGQ